MEKRDISFIQNLSISYECALAIGNSLNLEKMLHELIHKIAHKTNANHGSIWLCEKNEDNIKFKLGAIAGLKLSEEEIIKRTNFFPDIFKNIYEKQKPVLKNRDEKDFYKYYVNVTGKEQSVLIIPVKKHAIIHLVYSIKNIVDNTLVNMLTGLSPKLIVAIEACKAYENSIKEIQERKETENELKKRTEQLANGEKKLQKLYRESEDSRKSLLSIMEDVVEKEQALRKSEEKFKTVADYTYSWEYWIDPDRNFIYISPSCERISGYKPEEFFKDPELLEKIIHPDDMKKIINHRKIVSDSKKAGNVDFRIITRDGDIRYIEHVCHPVYGKDGKYLGRRATNRDITDNRRQETIRQIMYQISNAVYTTKDLNDFFKVIQLELGKVLKTKNFFIALYNKETDTLSLPYYIDEKDDFKTFPARKTLTAYVIKNKKAVILTEKEIKKLIMSGEIEVVGTISKIWLGVPLISKEEVTGVLAVQSYENEKDFNKKDLELLKFISGQIGLSIERKQSEDFIRVQRDIAMELNDVTSLSETLRVCLDATIRISGMDCGGIYLVDKNTGNMDLVFHKGLSEKFVKSASHFNADSDNARLIMKGKPVYSQHQKLDVDINNTRKQENLRAIAVIPVPHEGKVIACLNIASHFYDDVPANTRIALQAIAAQIGNVITRVNTAKELKDSEEKYRTLIDSIQDGVFVIHDAKMLFVNKAFAGMTGYSEEELIGMNFKNLIVPEDIEMVADHYYRRQAGEDILSEYEWSMLHKDKTTRVIVNMNVGLVNYANSVASMGTVKDITERKQAEQELAKHREHLEELVKERTKELEEKNEKLKQYNQLFEGREFRIKELKDRVKELEEKLGIWEE